MRSWGKFLPVALMAWVCAHVSSHADEPAANASTNREAAAEVRADLQSFDSSTKTWVGQGDVVIEYKDATLRADKVRYNQATGDAWAEGNVRLNRENQEWLGPSVYYNFDTHAMKAEQVRGFFEPVFLTASNVSLVASNHYTVPDVTVTTCDYEPPDFHLRASHAEIYPGDRIAAFNTSLWLGPVPVFWMPVVIWSLKGDNPPFTATVGHRTQWGEFVETTTNWRLNPNFNLAAHLNGYTKRGVSPGADLAYDFGKDVTGELRGFYLNDGDKNASNDPNPNRDLPDNRWLGEWKHKEFFPGDFSLTVDLNKQSDQDYVNDFFNQDYQRDSEPTSVADVTKRGDNYTLSVLTRPQFNSFYDEVERLPEAKLAIQRTRLGPVPAYYESQSSIGYYNNFAAPTNLIPADPLFNGSSLRVDTFHQISSPQMLFGWLSFVPRAGARYTYYERAPNTASDSNDVSRFVADLGSDVSFKLTRTWADVQNKPLGVDGLRHIIQPFADYQWIPNPNVNSNELFQFDTPRSIILSNGQPLLVTRYLPLEMPANDLVDAMELQNTLRFGLRQRLQTQRDGQPWDLVELTGWTDWHIEKTGGETDFSDFFGTLAIRPSQAIAFNSFARYDMQSNLLQELNTDTRVGVVDQWSIGLGTRYLKGDSNQIAVSTTLRLGRNWVASVYERFDMQDGQWQAQDYQLRQETHDWFITYGFTYSNSRSGSDNATGYVSVTLKAFPGARLGFN
jgi:LPS-assembly protein